MKADAALERDRLVEIVDSGLLNCRWVVALVDEANDVSRAGVCLDGWAWTSTIVSNECGLLSGVNLWEMFRSEPYGGSTCTYLS